MATHLLRLLVFLMLGMVVLSHGALSPELYWKSVLPNTAMPKAIRDDLEGKSTKWVTTNTKSKTITVDVPGTDNKALEDSLSIGYRGRASYKLGTDSKALADSLSIGYRGRASYKLGTDNKALEDSLSIGYRGRASYKLGTDNKALEDSLSIGYRGRASYKLGTDNKALADSLSIGYRGRASYKLGTDNKALEDSLSIGYRGRASYKLGTDNKALADSLSIGYRGRASYKLGTDNKALADSLSIGYRGRASYKLGTDNKALADSLSIGYRGRASYKLGTDNKVVLDNANNLEEDTIELELHLANPDNINLYFLEQDIKKGKTMTLDFSPNPSTKTAKFLPRQEAEKMPFSSEKLPEILKRFSVTPGSVEARTVETTLNDLEQPATKGQVDYVATSLESMVDFVTSEIGVKGGGVKAEATEVGVEGLKGDADIPIQQYTIVGESSKIVSPNTKDLVCHKQKYPYAVFYCHGLPNTRAYMVPLEGANGMKVKALALCHVDTSQWSPNHFAFKMLKIKQGTVPVCHFLPEDHIVWVPKN